MIVIEGPDGVGKTTFANKLLEYSARNGEPMTYHHMTRPSPGFDYFNDYVLMGIGGNIVRDRFHLGAVVYGQMLGLHSYQEDPTLLRALIRFVRMRRCVTVVITADDHWLRDSLEKEIKEKKREQMYNVNTIIQANKCFRAIASVSTTSSDPMCDYHIPIGEGVFPTAGAVADVFHVWHKRQ